MGWESLIPIGAQLLGSYLQNDSVNDAKSGAQTATNTATALQERMYDQTRKDNELRRYIGDNALLNLNNLAGYDPTPNAEDVLKTPGYQFGLDQGRKAIQGQAAARGGLYSGNALKELTKFGTDYGTSKWQDARNNMTADLGNRWNRISGLAGIGQAAQQQTQAAGTNYANNASTLGTQNAGYQGGADIAKGTIYGNAANQIASYGRNQEWWK
jgi:hypothetical protein